MNKVVFLCGSHMRHLYIANKFFEEGRLAALVIEEREQFVPEPPEGLTERDRNNFIHHFQERDRAEKEAFGAVDVSEMMRKVPVLRVSQEELNLQNTIDFIIDNQADMLISYGVHKVGEDIIKIHPERSFNIHGGLSPWYKGNTTLFWPFYFLKPNWAGMTIHRLSMRLDGGDILHHSVPKLAYGDTMHEVACKAVVQVAEDICRILDKTDAGKELVCVPQKGNGKLFVSSDWTPQTLRVIYELFDDKIVDLFLDGELEVIEPNLVNFLVEEKHWL